MILTQSSGQKWWNSWFSDSQADFTTCEFDFSGCRAPIPEKFFYHSRVDQYSSQELPKGGQLTQRQSVKECEHLPGVYGSFHRGYGPTPQCSIHPGNLLPGKPDKKIVILHICICNGLSPSLCGIHTQGNLPHGIYNQKGQGKIVSTVESLLTPPILSCTHWGIPIEGCRAPIPEIFFYYSRVDQYCSQELPKVGQITQRQSLKEWYLTTREPLWQWNLESKWEVYIRLNI